MNLDDVERRHRTAVRLLPMAARYGYPAQTVPGACHLLGLVDDPLPADVEAVCELGAEIKAGDDQREAAALARLGDCPGCGEGTIWADADRATCDGCGASAPKAAALEAFDERRPRPITEAAAWLTEHGDVVTANRVRRLVDLDKIKTHGVDEERRRLVAPVDIRVYLLREKLA